MKKIVASIGMAAVGASVLQTASAQPLGGGTDKPWSVSATLRGFYDDNILTTADNEEESFGIEARPSVRLVLPMDQTTLSMGYVYSMKWYAEEPSAFDEIAQTHLFDLGLSHAFSERYRLSLSDAFAIGQEADLFRHGGGFSGFQTIEGDNIRNFADIALEADLTPLYGITLGYNNAFFDYDADLNSALLDRLEHYISIDNRLILRPTTVGIFGYQFGMVDYTGDMTIRPGVVSEDRNNRSHYVYAGVDHNFTPELVGAFRGGARFNDYYNLDETDVSPYAKASLSYTYAPQSQVMLRVSYDRTATDVVGSAGDVVTDAQSIAIYLGLDHRIVSRLFWHAGAQYQNSEWQGGDLDGDADSFYSFDTNLRYEINRFFSTHIGYTFDKLDSDLAGREFDRNRVYIGVTATY